MTAPSDETFERRTKKTLEIALQHREPEFKAAILEMALLNRWDVDDPGFLSLVASGEMQLLLKRYPAQFEALMNRVFRQSETHWKTLNAELLTALSDTENSAQMFTQKLTDFERLVEHEKLARTTHIEKIKQVMTQERTDIEKQVRQLMTEQLQTVTTAMTDISDSHRIKSENQVRNQLHRLVRGLRKKWFFQTAWGCIIGVGIIGVGLIGWSIQHNKYQVTLWEEIARQNYRTLSDCMKAQQTTCNVNLQPPN